MKEVDVDSLRFSFDDRWTVVEKWDDSPAYQGGIATLNGEIEDELTVGTKAVDLVGICDGQLYLIEVKDYRGHAIDTKQRQTSALPLSIACKVRDTIAGLVGASRKGSADWVDGCVGRLRDRARPIWVIAWIVDAAPRPAEPDKKRMVWQGIRRKRLEQKLAWLTSKVLLHSPLSTSLPGVTAKSLPGAGQR